MKKFILLFVLFSFSFSQLTFSQRAVRASSSANSRSSSSTKRAASTSSTKRAASTSSTKRASSTSKNTKRAATSSSSLRSATGSNRSSSSASSRSSSKSSSGNKSKTSGKKVVVAKSSTTDQEDGEEAISEQLACLKSNLSSILEGSCKFVLDDSIKEMLQDHDLYCVYNYKDSGKTKSIANYYLSAYYGISESSVKDNTTIVNVKNSAKNALMYYQYLIDEISNGTLKESKILDNITETILDNADIDYSVSNTISARTVESVPLSINVIASDIENCADKAKEIMRECNAVGKQDVKKAINESCSVYQSVVLKLAGDKKAEALGFENELLTALKERANADFYDFKEQVEMESEKLELEQLQYDTNQARKLLEKKNSREEYANKANELAKKIAAMDEDEDKTAQEATYNAYISQICALDKTILSIDSSYVPGDNLCPEISNQDEDDNDD